MHMCVCRNEHYKNIRKTIRIFHRLLFQRNAKMLTFKLLPFLCVCMLLCNIVHSLTAIDVVVEIENVFKLTDDSTFSPKDGSSLTEVQAASVLLQLKPLLQAISRSPGSICPVFTTPEAWPGKCFLLYYHPSVKTDKIDTVCFFMYRKQGLATYMPVRIGWQAGDE